MIGSGPGGAVAAYRLACLVPGARIAVLERGARYSPLQDFNERELEMIAKLYKEGGVQQAKRADMIILQGECVGGSSVVNNAVCYTMPERVRASWRNDAGLELPGLDAAYAQVAGELGIGPLRNVAINQKVVARFERAVAGVNTQPGGPLLATPEVVQVNGPSAVGDGLWNVGNKYFGKRSMLETYVPWSEARGVCVVPNATAVSMDISNGRATSVLVSTGGGDLKRIRVKRSVVVAGGVISSSHLLMNSALGLPVGQRMSCNFALPATFEVEEPLRAFDGEQITSGARDLKNRAIFETYFNPPGAFALTVPFSMGRHTQVMARYPYLFNIGALVGSEPRGVVDRQGNLIDGQPFEWSLGPDDQSNIRFALETLLALGKEAGALRAVLPTRPGVEFDYRRDSLSLFAQTLGARPLRMEDVMLTSAHPQGGNTMAAKGSPLEAKRVVDERFCVQGLENVFVTDASVFPSSLTVNPQWTILALSTLAAPHIV